MQPGPSLFLPIACQVASGVFYCMYGDGIYVPHLCLRSATGVAAVDKPLNSAREAIEHSYGEKGILFPFMTNKKKLKIKERDLSALYFMCSLLRSCYTCMYHDKSSDRFDISPPSFDEYMSWA